MLWLALGTGLFVGFVLGVIWGKGRLQSWLGRLAADKTKGIASFHLRRLSLQQFIVFLKGILQGASFVLLFVATCLWLIFVFSRFDLTRPYAEGLLNDVLLKAAGFGQDLLGALPGFAAVLIVFIIARFAHRLINQFFETIVKSGLTSDTFDPATAETTRRIAQVFLWVSAVIIAYPYIPGSSSPAFRGVSVLAGLMFSLGSTNLVSQLTNGLILTYTRAIRSGDVIKTGEHEGTVVSLGFFTTTIRTAREEIVSLPNSQLASGLINYSTPREGKSVRFSVGVGIGYDTAWQQVHELMLSAADKVDAVAEDPAPEVRQTALNDFAVQYELMFSLKDPETRVAVTSALNTAIQEAFHSAGVQIMSPHYIADPSEPKMPPGKSG